MSDPELDPQKIVNELTRKYGEYNLTYEDLLERVVNLEDELPIPYEEAMNDLILWKKALEALGNGENIALITDTEENEENTEE